ncbi:hypothetical protein SADUNF_Sadunf11G0003900 [Salix dunnii]|uniref:TF-B3 domain-containing protein n=1 Tax=Salix dunnii TaxID=1413687 RepID=A0A835MWG4_9ROSI|nr:hypothetical protein SADUNF_Sadunf11G0003900 [Salix dunnii]
MPDGRNSVEFVASDIHEQQWRLKVSVRNEGRYAKPCLKGEWDDYVHQKQLRKGDRVILTMDGEENGERIYRIRAERKLFVIPTSFVRWSLQLVTSAGLPTSGWNVPCLRKILENVDTESCDDKDAKPGVVGLWKELHNVDFNPVFDFKTR